MRNNISKFIVSLLSLALACGALSERTYAQEPADDSFLVEGTILDANTRQPLSGAQISSISLAKTVVTGNDGKFSVRCFDPQARLKVFKVGYYVKNIGLFGRNSIVVYLQDEEKTLSTDKYNLFDGERDWSERSSQVGVLASKNINPAYPTLSEALAGKLAGLRVATKSGMPGEGALVNLRGVRSLNGKNTPLLVLDGVPIIMDENESSVINGYSPDILESVNLGNVETMSFLKGADALEYGSLGSNGVLLVETERGKVSRTLVEYMTVEGVGQQINTIPLLSGLDFTRYLAEVGSSYFSTSADVVNAFPFLGYSMDANQTQKYSYNTDWQDLIYTTAKYSDNKLKIRGGDEVVQYLVTAGYQLSQGVVSGTQRAKFNTAGNTNINFSDKLKAYASVSFDYIDTDVQEQGMTEETNPMLAAYAHSPITGVYDIDENGGVLTDFAPIDEYMQISNPAAIVSDIEASEKVYDFDVAVGVNYNFLKKLKLDGKFGIFYKYIKDDIFIGGRTGAIKPLRNGLALNTVRNGSKEAIDYYGKIALSYNYAKEGHNLDASAGYQIISARQFASSGSGINTATDRYKNLNNTSSAERNTGGYADILRWTDAFVKGEYNYQHKYYFTATGLMDASSSYGAYSGRYFFFPALKAGWRMSEAPFMAGSSVSNMMVRAEYSINPNGRFSNNYSSYYYQLSLLRDISGLTRAGLPNQKIGPERVNNYDLGIDFSTYGDKLSVSLDFFREQTNNMIVTDEADYVYGWNAIYKNSGKMRTNGIELGLSAAIIDRGFQWRIGGNLSWADSKILSLGGKDQEIITITDDVTVINKVGEAPFSFFGQRADGVYKNAKQARKYGLSTISGRSFGAGDIKFIDTDGDKVITDDDRVVIGSQLPDVTGGIFSNMKWRGFNLYANFTFNYGNEIYNGVRRYTEQCSGFSNQAASVSRRWVFDGQETDIPKVTYGDPAGNNRFSTRWIEDGSYIKLKELTFSWETKEHFLFMTGYKIFLTGQNLFTLTNYSGLDPELAYNYDISMSGMDLAKVASPRMVKIGMVMNF